jgi:hypothetical protein
MEAGLNMSHFGAPMSFIWKNMGTVSIGSRAKGVTQNRGTQTHTEIMIKSSIFFHKK